VRIVSPVTSSECGLWNSKIQFLWWDSLGEKNDRIIISLKIETLKQLKTLKQNEPENNL